jgi:hypothetical protein
VSRDMLDVIERIAGEERAIQMRERIALLLPP